MTEVEEVDIRVLEVKDVDMIELGEETGGPVDELVDNDVLDAVEDAAVELALAGTSADIEDAAADDTTVVVVATSKGVPAAKAAVSWSIPAVIVTGRYCRSAPVALKDDIPHGKFAPLPPALVVHSAAVVPVKVQCTLMVKSVPSAMYQSYKDAEAVTVAPGAKPQRVGSSPGGQPIEKVTADGPAAMIDASRSCWSARSKKGKDVVEVWARIRATANRPARSTLYTMSKEWWLATSQDILV